MKRVITWFLIVFIVVAVATKIVLLNVPQEPPLIHDGKYIVLFHTEARCVTCTKMEFLIKKVLKEQKHNDLDLLLVEYDMPKNKELVERFHVGATAIILMEQANGKTFRSCDISTEAWNLIRNSNDFVEMLQTKLSEFYEQTRHQ